MKKTIEVDGKEITREDALAMVDALFCDFEQDEADEIAQDIIDENAFKAQMLDRLLIKSQEMDCESAWVFGYLDALREIFGSDDFPFDDYCDADCRNCPDKEECEGSYT